MNTVPRSGLHKKELSNLYIGLILFGFWSISVLFPVLLTLGTASSFFVAHSASAAQIIPMLIIVAIVIPAILTFLVILLRRANSTLGKWVFVFISAILATLFLLYASSSFRVPAIITILVAAVLGVLAALSTLKFENFRFIVALASVVTLILPFYFIFSTQSGKHVRSRNVQISTESPPLDQKPVTLIVFDEFSPLPLIDQDGNIDSIRYPNFARLSEMSTWYPNAASVHYRTSTAVPAILTGLNPVPGRGPAPTVSEYPNNLFTILGPHAETNITETFTSLCSKEVCNDQRRYFILRNFLTDFKVVLAHTYTPIIMAERILPPLTEGWSGFGKTGSEDGHSHDHKQPKSTDEDLKAAALKRKKDVHSLDRREIFRKFVNNINNSEQAFDFVHVLLPHTGWKYLPDGRGYQSRSMGREWDTQGKADEVYHRYQLQLGFADTLLGQALNKLEESGRMDETLLIIVADHGLNFKAGQDIRDIAANPSVLHIPMFIKFPGQTVGVKDGRHARNIDVLPTIADALKISLPQAVDGVSLKNSMNLNREAFNVEQGGKVFHLNNNDIANYNIMPDMVKRFSNRTKLQDMTAGGPFANLIGMPINRPYDIVEITEPESVEVEVSLKQNIAVDLKSEFLPSLFWGSFTNLQVKDSIPHLAVAVNGKISGVVPIYEVRSYHEFSLVIPTAAFRNGKNKVESYLVSETHLDRIRLTPINLEGSTKKLRDSSNKLDEVDYRLFPSLDGLTVQRSEDGKKFLIVKQPRPGAYTQSSNNLETKLAGWAADVEAGEPALAVIAFSDGKMVDYTDANKASPRLGELYPGTKLGNSKFYLNLPASVATTDKPLELYAIYKNGKAALLPDTTKP